MLLSSCFPRTSAMPSGEHPGPGIHVPDEKIVFRTISVDDGLSQNMITALFQDHKGFIWIGTKGGLNLYDGYHFKVYKFDPSDPFSLNDNYVTAIYEDSFKRLWIGTLSGGLFYMDRKTGRFLPFRHDPVNENSLSDNHITSITGDSKGHLWVGTNGGGLNRIMFAGTSGISEKTGIVIERFNKPGNGFPEIHANINTLFIDDSDQLWVGTDRNVFRLTDSGEHGRFVRTGCLFEDNIPGPGSDIRGDPGGARAIFRDSDGRLWMGNGYGLFILDREKQVFVPSRPGGNPVPYLDVLSGTAFTIRQKEKIWIGSTGRILILDPESGSYSTLSGSSGPRPGLPGGWYTSMLRDMGGSLWIGTNGHGLSLLSPGSMKFNYPDYAFDTPDLPLASIRDLSVRAFYMDSDGSNNLWIGSNDGVCKADPDHASVTKVLFKGIPGGKTGTVYHICGDEKGILWIASDIGLVEYDPGKNLARIRGQGISGKNQDPGIRYVLCQGDEVWILTANALARFDRQSQEFQSFTYDDHEPDRFSKDVFPSMMEDGDGNFWIGANNGLHYFNKTSLKFISPSGEDENMSGLLTMEIRSIINDPAEPGKYLWFGTAKSGIVRLDLKTGKMINYTEHEGLANNIVYGMLSDDSGNIWISTNLGLSRFDPRSERFVNYTTSDGLQGNEFNRGAYYKSWKGELFFGGIRGYNSFFPSRITANDFMAPIVLTGFRLYDRDHRTVYNRGIDIRMADHMELAHNENHFTIDFASLDFASPQNNEFAFSMSNAEDSWIYTGHDRSVTFTELKPGNYTLKVRGTNSDGIWSNKEAVLDITVLPPWWKNRLTWLVYLSLFLGILFSIRRYELSRLRLKNQMKIAQIKSKRLEELDRLKSRFFANISHEFRTPLTLIKGPLESLLAESTDLQKKDTFRQMHYHANRLLQLINQLLDLSMIENGKYTLKIRKGDLISFVEGLTMSFASRAESAKIRLSFMAGPGLEKFAAENPLYYDQDVVEKILTNLLSNALKFTPDNGHIRVELNLDARVRGDEMVEVIVEDTGIGIPEDKLPYIFDRFYQADPGKNKGMAGTGLGLAYVNELVRLHQGKIFIRSEPGKGSIFTVVLPVRKDRFNSGDLIEEEMSAGSFAPAEDPGVFPAAGKPLPEVPGKTGGKPCVLVVEDHPEVRRFIAGSLDREYVVLQCSDAAEGMIVAKEFIPDLIISDLMMPGTDGFEFCEKIKTNEITSHIPFVLLTARGGEDDRIRGLQTGADEYITKPFSAKELLIRTRNLIANRRLLRQKFSSKSVIIPGEIQVTPYDRSFVEKALRLVEENLDNIHYSVEMLAQRLGMSQSQLHRKLKAVVNMTALQFIRSVRMNRSMELLKNNAGNISEIAYMVGYDDPGYFSKSFHKFFGKLPSEIGKKSGK